MVQQGVLARRSHPLAATVSVTSVDRIAGTQHPSQARGRLLCHHRRKLLVRPLRAQQQGIVATGPPQLTGRIPH